jgi:NifU-like protein involved in Fe-S cluster formation
MKSFLSLALLAALCGCGVETASTAATAGQVKRQEMEQGKKTMDNMQHKINQSMGEMQRRPENLEK